VYVLKNRVIVHSDQISGYYSEPESSSPFSDFIALNAGDTIDFTVGAVTGQGLAYDGGFHLVQFDATFSTDGYCGGGAGFEYFTADFDRDCDVDMDDFVFFASHWLAGSNP
jgi:hypothetical protein